MLSITKILQVIIHENEFLQFGLSHRLLNLSQLSKFLKPLIEVRTQKKIQIAAITMNLSRLQRRMTKILSEPARFQAENILIYSDLSTMTFSKAFESHKSIQKFYAKVQEEDGYITLTEGGHEITLIFEKKFIPLAQKIISEKPKYENHDLVSVGIKFSPKYANIPGFIYTVLQRITLQGINTVELSSTYTELILYVERKDAKLAFETIFQSFSGDHSSLSSSTASKTTSSSSISITSRSTPHS